MELAGPGCRDLDLALLCFKLTCGSGKPKFSLLWPSVSLIWSLRGRAGWCLEKILPFLISSVYNQRRQWHPTPVLLPGKSHGRRSLGGCNLWGCYELDTTEPLHFHFHALEEEMATHFSVLAWRIPGTEEPGGLPSMGSHRVEHNWSNLATAAAAAVFIIGKNQIKGITFNGWSKKLPTQGSQKHPSNLERCRDCRWGLDARSRDMQRLQVGAGCQTGTCYLFPIWQRTKQLAQDLCKTNYPPVKSQKGCLLPPRIDVSVLSLCPRKPLRYGLLHVSSVYTSALVGSQELENAGMAFIPCFSCYAENQKRCFEI